MRRAVRQSFDPTRRRLYPSRAVIPTERALRPAPRRRRAWLASALLLAACDRPAQPTVPDAIVSLSPAATSLIVAIGGRDRLVGVSTYESDPRVAALPRVGDYENVDWERIRSLAPRHLITQVAPDRLPTGFVEQARKIDCAVRPIHIDRLEDIRVAIEQIGEELSLVSAARETWSTIRSDLDAVRAAHAGERPVRTLIVTSDDGLGVAGVDNFLDDLLQVAGGTNAVGAGRPGYFKLDREQLLKLDPEAIVLLLPDANADSASRARQTFEAMSDLAAVKSNRLRVVTRGDSLMPNANVAQTARDFDDAIHGKASQ